MNTKEMKWFKIGLPFLMAGLVAVTVITSLITHGFAACGVGRHPHKLVKVEAVAANCTQTGNIEHWECENCHRYFTREDGTGEVDADKLTVPALGHVYSELHEAVAATCEKSGSIAYYRCLTCGADFNVNLDQVTTPSIKAKGHQLLYHAPQEATCARQGNIEYWECADCGVYCWNASGNKDSLIADQSSVFSAKLNHTMSEYVSNYDATATSDGTQTATCQACGYQNTKPEQSTMGTIAAVKNPTELAAFWDSEEFTSGKIKVLKIDGNADIPYTDLTLPAEVKYHGLTIVGVNQPTFTGTVNIAADDVTIQGCRLAQAVGTGCNLSLIDCEIERTNGTAANLLEYTYDDAAKDCTLVLKNCRLIAPLALTRYEIDRKNPAVIKAIGTHGHTKLVMTGCQVYTNGYVIKDSATSMTIKDSEFYGLDALRTYAARDALIQEREKGKDVQEYLFGALSVTTATQMRVENCTFAATDAVAAVTANKIDLIGCRFLDGNLPLYWHNFVKNLTLTDVNDEAACIAQVKANNSLDGGSVYGDPNLTEYWYGCAAKVRICGADFCLQDNTFMMTNLCERKDLLNVGAAVIIKPVAAFTRAVIKDNTFVTTRKTYAFCWANGVGVDDKPFAVIPGEVNAMYATVCAQFELVANLILGSGNYYDGQFNHCYYGKINGTISYLSKYMMDYKGSINQVDLP